MRNLHQMGPNVPLDMILKKFTIIYGNVKSFDLLMRDFYRADQGEHETIPSFATCIEGLLSQIRDRFPNQLPLQEEQRLLKDHLFHGSWNDIRDSLKYCFARCFSRLHAIPGGMPKGWGRGEGRASQSKGKGSNSYTTPHKGWWVVKATQISTISNRCLGGTSENLCVSGKSHTILLKGLGPPLMVEGPMGQELVVQGGGGSWRKDQPSQLGASSPSKSRNPQQGQGVNRTNKQYQCWQCGDVGHLKRDCPTLKRKRAVSRGECVNSP